MRERDLTLITGDNEWEERSRRRGRRGFGLEVVGVGGMGRVRIRDVSMGEKRDREERVRRESDKARGAKRREEGC